MKCDCVMVRGDCMTFHICPDYVIKSGTKLINRHLLLITTYNHLLFIFSSLHLTGGAAGTFYLQPSCKTEFFSVYLSKNLISIYWSIIIISTETIKMILFMLKYSLYVFCGQVHSAGHGRILIYSKTFT